MLLTEISQKSNKYLDYHDSLSTKIWDGDQLKPEVRSALKKIAKEFIKTLDVPEQQVVDIIIAGSLCNYNYTKYSDIDLHIILDYSDICDDCHTFNIDDCMKAKKSLWNDRHDITIYGMDVELYAQDVSEHLTGNAGIFSILNNKWNSRPVKETKVDYGNRAINDKAKNIMYEIDTFIDEKSNDIESLKKLKDKIKDMRKAGLEATGEHSIENLAFKVLRNSGYIEKLFNYMLNIEDHELSLE